MRGTTTSALMGAAVLPAVFGLTAVAAVPGAAAAPALAPASVRVAEPVQPIPQGPGAGLVPRYLGAPATPRPFAGRPIPANPCWTRR